MVGYYVYEVDGDGSSSSRFFGEETEVLITGAAFVVASESWCREVGVDYVKNVFGLSFDVVVGEFVVETDDGAFVCKYEFDDSF